MPLNGLFPMKITFLFFCAAILTAPFATTHSGAARQNATASGNGRSVQTLPFRQAERYVQSPGEVAKPLDPDSATCTLLIHVDGFRNSKGVLGSVVFASAEGWPEDSNKALKSGPFQIDEASKTATAEWKLTPGQYGLAVIHDENSNQKLDRGFLGIPKEGFGFANNLSVMMRAPAFKDAAIRVTCPVTETNIHLIYK